MHKDLQEEPERFPRKKRNVLAFAWIILAMAVLFPITIFLHGTFPIFTFILLAVPLFNLISRRDAEVIGIRAVKWMDILKYAGINLAGSLGIMLICEPWSQTYTTLLKAAVSSANPDTTFAWLIQFPGLTGWLSFVLYTGLVTLFAEELFFRGWLLNVFKNKMNDWKAILLQAILFTLLQSLASIMLPLTQGVLYSFVYSFLAIGLLNGWTASRTRSIWPCLISATVANLVMCLLYFQAV